MPIHVHSVEWSDRSGVVVIITNAKRFPTERARPGQAGSTHPIDKVFPERWLGSNDLV